MTEVRHKLYGLLARPLPPNELCHEIEQLLGKALAAKVRLHLPNPLYLQQSHASEYDRAADEPISGQSSKPIQLSEYSWMMAGIGGDVANDRPQWATEAGTAAGDTAAAGTAEGEAILLPVAFGRRSTALLSLRRSRPLSAAMRHFLDDMLPSIALAIRHSLQYQRQRQATTNFATRLRASRTLEHLRSAAQRSEASQKELAEDLHAILVAALRPADPRLLLRVRIGRAVCSDPHFRLSRLAGKAEFCVEGRVLGDLQTMLAPVAPDETQWLPEISSHLRSTLLVDAARQITIGLEHRQLVRQYQCANRDERHRLARELHDSVGPALTGVALLAATLQQRLAAHDAETSALAADLSRVASQAVSQVRDYSHRQAQSSTAANLRQALRQIAKRTRQQYGMQCDLELKDEVADLKQPTLVANLSAIAQEAIVNASRHGRARQVRLRLERRRQRLIFTIVDDGCGFDQKQHEKSSSGIGLQNIRQRAADLGGRLSIQAHPGQGTTLHCRFPAHYFFAEAEDCAIWRP